MVVLKEYFINMDKQVLEYYLDKGTIFGFNLDYNPKTICWLLLEKRKPIKDFFKRFKKSDNSNLYNEQLYIKNNPYAIWIGEVDRFFYDSEITPLNKDYLKNEYYHFKSLEDIEFYLNNLGLNLAQIKWGAEVIFI
jgi:hypothetical protein